MSRANDLVHQTMMGTGITIREHVAIEMMKAIIGTAGAPCLVGALGGAEEEAAKSAIKIADALIAALAKAKP